MKKIYKNLFFSLLVAMSLISQAWSGMSYEECRNKWEGDWKNEISPWTEVNQVVGGKPFANEFKSIVDKLKTDTKAAKKNCDTINGAIKTFIDEVLKKYQNIQSCIAINNLTQKGSDGPSSSESYSSQSTNLLMSTGSIGSMSGSTSGTSSSQANAVNNGLNSMMAMAAGGDLKCKSMGKETRDYQSCTRILKTFDAAALAQMAEQTAVKNANQVIQAKAQQDVLLSQGKDPNIYIDKMKEQVKNAEIVSWERMSVEVLKGGMFTTFAAMMPTHDNLVSDCTERIKDKGGVALITELRSRVSESLNVVNNLSCRPSSGGNGNSNSSSNGNGDDSNNDLSDEES